MFCVSMKCCMDLHAWEQLCVQCLGALSLLSRARQCCEQQETWCPAAQTSL